MWKYQHSFDSGAAHRSATLPETPHRAMPPGLSKIDGTLQPENTAEALSWLKCFNSSVGEALFGTLLLREGLQSGSP